MTPLLIAFSIALLLTTIFAFRFRTWKRKGVLVAYFLLFFVIELIAEQFFIPAGALGMEMVYICLALSAVFTVVTVLAHRYEEALARDEG